MLLLICGYLSRNSNMGDEYLNIADIVSLLGGVALFLFGITLMGEGLKRVAGNKLELVLYRLSGTPLKAILLGAGVTAVIQSSSATSVMVVGFVNSGMMKLEQAINVILGALIGTSITGWIICLSSIDGAGGWVSLLSTSTITAIVAVIGIILRMFSKKQIHHHVGDILLGFSVLMYGMSAMSGSVSDLKNSPQFVQMMTTFSNPFLGILAGAAFTAVLQSASAAVGILQALSMTGAINFATAYPVILGIAIGAAVPVLLSALGAKVNGRRAAFSYLMLEILGVLFCGSVYYLLVGIGVLNLGPWKMTPVTIAAVNSIFRIITALVLFPFTPSLTKLSCMLIKEMDTEEAESKDLDKLDERFLQHPALAVEQSRLVVNSMAKMAQKNMLGAFSLLKNFSEEAKRKIEDREDRVDLYEDRLGTYLVKLNTNELSIAQNESVSKYLHTLSDFERISDHSINVCDVASEMHEKNLSFSENAQKEIEVISSAIMEVLDLAVSAFRDNDVEKAYLVEPLEERIDILCDEMKMRHVDRLQKGACSLSQGFIFNDLLTNYERVADHCSNIAIAIIELQSDCFDTHGYIINLKELRSHDFDRHYEEYSQKYHI